MHMAHALFNHFQDLEAVSVSGKHSWGDALTEAWRVLRVREALSKGVYYLTYYKGIEIQCRRATLCPDFIPSSAAPKGTRDAEIEQGLTKGSWDVINYYDLDKQGWRSFKIAALQRVKRITVDIRYETCHVDAEPIYD